MRFSRFVALSLRCKPAARGSGGAEGPVPSPSRMGGFHVELERIVDRSGEEHVSIPPCLWTHPTTARIVYSFGIGRPGHACLRSGFVCWRMGPMVPFSRPLGPRCTTRARPGCWVRIFSSSTKSEAQATASSILTIRYNVTRSPCGFRGSRINGSAARTYSRNGRSDTNDPNVVDVALNARSPQNSHHGEYSCRRNVGVRARWIFQRIHWDTGQRSATWPGHLEYIWHDFPNRYR